jgi:S1-C subfamily serine protease
MGSGHIRFGYGVPHQLRDLNVKNVGTLLPVGVGLGCKELKSGLADAVFALPELAKAKPEPPRLGVRLEEKDGTVRVLDVTAGSLAERTGLKAGDEVVEVAGLPAKRNLIVIAAIRMQPAGTWLPIRVKRGNETMELVIKFPARQ